MKLISEEILKIKKIDKKNIKSEIANESLKEEVTQENLNEDVKKEIDLNEEHLKQIINENMVSDFISKNTEAIIVKISELISSNPVLLNRLLGSDILSKAIKLNSKYLEIKQIFKFFIKSSMIKYKSLNFSF
jgi:hypothetical protein